jgi:hypothetical protein
MVENGNGDHDKDKKVEEAIHHLRDAERDLAKGKTGAAAREVERALEELEEAQHPHEHWVVVNGRRREVKGEKLTYEEVVLLAFTPPPSGPDVQITVQYTHGPEHKPTGALIEGQSVKIRDGMVFDVTATNRS